MVKEEKHSKSYAYLMPYDKGEKEGSLIEDEYDLKCKLK